jgi:hypothetical protein
MTAEDERRSHPTYLPRPSSGAERVVLGLLLLLGLAIVAVLVVVDPDPRGLGTHEQLGMKPCTWPQTSGGPCPTCGVTTAAALLVHLRPLAAFRTQPFGALLTLAGIVLLVCGFRHLWRGESLFARVASWPWGRIALAAIATLLASWWYTTRTFVAR